MKQVKMLTALILSALLLTASLAGCSLPGASASPTPSPTGEDVIQDLTGLSRDTILFTVNGRGVAAEEYLFWLSQTISYMDQYAKYLGETGINWDEDMSGLSMADYCKNDAMETSKLYALVELRAEQEGCTFNDENAAALQTEIDSMIEQLGGQEKYELWLFRTGLSEEGMNHLNRVSYVYNNLQDALYGEGSGNAPTDESMDNYIAENDLLSAKHILLLTVDMNNYDSETKTYASLSDDVIAGKRAQAEDLLAQLRASDDPAALFDTLMNEYSEDSGLSSNPDGYEFTAGEMATEFETATRMLEFGEISDIVESGYGYHIILRQDPDTEALRSEWIGTQMNAMMEEMVANAVVETTAEYDSLDLKDYYTKLLAHQAEVDALLNPTESDAAPTDSAAVN